MTVCGYSINSAAQNSMWIRVEVSSSLTMCAGTMYIVAISTADFQPIEIFVWHGVDDVTYPLMTNFALTNMSSTLGLQTVCWEDRTAKKSGV